MTGEGVTTTSAHSAVNDPQPPSGKVNTTVYQVVPTAFTEGVNDGPVSSIS